MKKNDCVSKGDTPQRTLLKNLIASAILVALGVLLMLRPDFATNTVASILGWVLIGGGAILIAVDLMNWDVMGLAELLVGIAAAAVGLFIVIRPEFLVDLFSTFIGVYLGFQCFLNLAAAVNLKKTGKIYLPTLILGLVLLTLALILFFVSPDESYFLMRTVGVLMIAGGLANLVLRSKFFTELPNSKSKNGANWDDD